MKLYGRDRQAAERLDAQGTQVLRDEFAVLRTGHGQSVHRRRILAALDRRGEPASRPSHTPVVATVQNLEMTRINLRRVAMQAYEQGVEAATRERVYSREKRHNPYAEGIAKAAFDLGHAAETQKPGWASAGTDIGALPKDLEALVTEYMGVAEA